MSVNEGLNYSENDGIRILTEETSKHWSDFDHTSQPIRDSVKHIMLLSSACFLSEINRNKDKCFSRLQIEPVWIIWLGGGSQRQRTGSQN